MKVEIHATTHIGRVRNRNEDNFLLLNLSNSSFWKKSNGSDEFLIQSQKIEVDERGIVLAVSDGCGGALGGDLSSEMAVETVRSMLTGEVLNLEQSFYQGKLIEKLYEATLCANSLIHNCQRNDSQYSGMGCTLTSVAINTHTVDFIQVGDSRGYLVRKGKIYQITKDQSLVNQLIDANQITPEEAETHALRNVILQALGAQNEVYPDVVRLIQQKDDILLLCSDGLSNKLTDFALLRIILNDFNNLENACKVLVQEANERGGEDNITVGLVKLLDNGLINPIDDSVVIYPLNFDIQAKSD